jgi:predicted oxidoreductase
MEDVLMLERIRLEADGPEIPRIVAGMMRLGDWDLSAVELCRWIESALELGLTAFDHADIYGDYTCEALFGKALTQMPAVRSEIQLVTKCGIQLISKNNPASTVKHYDTTRMHIITSVEHSLDNLSTDYIDLLLIHRPDPLMNADEVAGTFVELRDSGKTPTRL